MADKKCLNCGKMIQDWYELCPFCKAEQNLPDEDLSYLACPNCKHRVDIEDIECANCGKALGSDLIIVSPGDDGFNNTSNSETALPRNASEANDLNPSDRYLKQIAENTHDIKQYLKFFVILTVIFLAIYLISTFVSCHAACKAAEELNKIYSFIPYI